MDAVRSLRTSEVEHLLSLKGSTFKKWRRVNLEKDGIQALMQAHREQQLNTVNLLLKHLDLSKEDPKTGINLVIKAAIDADSFFSLVSRNKNSFKLVPLILNDRRVRVMGHKTLLYAIKYSTVEILSYLLDLDQSYLVDPSAGGTNILLTTALEVSLETKESTHSSEMIELLLNLDLSRGVAQNPTVFKDIINSLDKFLNVIYNTSKYRPEYEKHLIDRYYSILNRVSERLNSIPQESVDSVVLYRAIEYYTHQVSIWQGIVADTEHTYLEHYQVTLGLRRDTLATLENISRITNSSFHRSLKVHSKHEGTLCSVCYSPGETEESGPHVLCFTEGDIPIVDSIVKCGHKFHKKCVDDWFKAEHVKEQKCPICRAKVISTYEISSSPLPAEIAEQVAENRATVLGLNAPGANAAPAANASTNRNRRVERFNAAYQEGVANQLAREEQVRRQRANAAGQQANLNANRRIRREQNDAYERALAMNRQKEANAALAAQQPPNGMIANGENIGQMITPNTLVRSQGTVAAKPDVAITNANINSLQESYPGLPRGQIEKVLRAKRGNTTVTRKNLNRISRV
jgi:hypothetical protein